MKYSAFTFIAFFAVMFVACVHGWLPDIIEEIPQSEELVIDSCDLTVYNSPNFRCVSQRQTSDMPDTAIIKWRGEVRTWISGGVQTANISALVLDIINFYIGYNQAFVIDNTTTDNGVMDIRYIICFTNPNGLWSEGAQDLIYTEWSTEIVCPPVPCGTIETVRQAAWVQNPRSLWMNDIPIDAGQVTSFLDALPSLKKFDLTGNNMDSASIDLIHEALLSGCKTGLTVDTSDMPMSVERLEQYIYQEITLQ